MVEAPGRVAVVLQAQVGLRHALLRPGQLRRRQGQAGELQPLLNRQLGESAPAAADLEHMLPGLGAQALEDAAVLRVLGAGQAGVVVGTEEGTRVAHARVEPALVEGIAQVVVRHDVALAAAARVAVAPVAQARGQQARPGAVDGAAQRVAVVCQQCQQRRQVGRFPMAVEVGLGQSDIAARQHLAEHRHVVHLQLHRLVAVAEQMRRAVGQAQFEAAATQLAQQLAHEGRGAVH